MNDVSNKYDFPIRGLEAYRSHRPIYSPEELRLLESYKETVSITKNAYIRNSVLEILENQAIGRFHTKLAGIILGRTREIRTIIGEETIEVKNLGEDFNRVKEFFHDISQTPPEFSIESLNDPLERNRIMKYISVKNRMVYYPLPLLLYLFENVLGKKVLLIFTRDLVGGQPATEMNLPGGRDIDYFVVVKGSVDDDTKRFSKVVEAYLDNLFGTALINYMFKEASIKNERLELDFSKPYNEIIEHNIIEVHVISDAELENYLYVSFEDGEGYQFVDEWGGKKVFVRPKATDIRVYNMIKYRLRVMAAVEKALEELGIPADESKTPEEFERRIKAMITEKSIKFGLLDVGWEQ